MIVAIFTLFDLFLFQKNDKNLFYPLKYDPLVKNEELSDDKEDYMKDHFETHYKEVSAGAFGDISLLTLYLYKPVEIEEKEIESAKKVIRLIDESHATFILLQGVSETIITIISKFLESNDHYRMVNHQRGSSDSLTGNKKYLPIIYDSNLVINAKNDYFTTEEKVPRLYGSYMEVTDTRIKNGVTYTVINVDLYSSFPEINSAEFSNIAIDILENPIIKSKPVFIGGNIATLGETLKELTELSFKNLIDEDVHNKKLSKTTDHTNGNDDNIQRDFILLRDPFKMFTVNYARILSKFSYGIRYPVYSILTFKQNIDNAILQKMNNHHILADKNKKKDDKVINNTIKTVNK